MEYPSYQEYLRKQREAYAKEGKSFDYEMKKHYNEEHKIMRKYLPNAHNEADLYFNNMN